MSRGYFHTLSRPLYVAAGSREELKAFLIQENLDPGEVLRVGCFPLRTWCGRKVLILLPRWHHDPATADVVSLWVGDDGYTAEMDLNEPVTVPWWREMTPGRVMVLTVLILWGLALWLFLVRG